MKEEDVTVNLATIPDWSDAEIEKEAQRLRAIRVRKALNKREKEIEQSIKRLQNKPKELFAKLIKDL